MSFDEPTNVTRLFDAGPETCDKINAIVLEDNHFDRQAMERVVDRSELVISLTFVETLAELSRKIGEREFDVAIVDFRLPDGTGFDALKLISQSNLNAKCAGVMVASEAEATVAVSAMKSGCADYIVKDDLSPATLRRAITSAKQKANLKSRLNEAGKKLVTLRGALREHGETSNSIVRPLMQRSLTQLRAIEFEASQSGNEHMRHRFEVLLENLNEVLSFCETLERDAQLASDIAIKDI